MKLLADLDVTGKTVLVRVDYNVPLADNGRVEDDTRIKETLPTLRNLLEHQAAIILLSHLGRPKGKKDPKFSLRPVISPLEKGLNKKVYFFDGEVGSPLREAASWLKSGEILLVENLRFYPGEEGNDPAFSAALASAGTAFVQDAFGVVHRTHASTVGIPKVLPSAAGLLLENEIKIFSELLSNPVHPYIALLGGAKVSDKLEMIQNLLAKLDALFIGGGMAFTFLKAAGYDVGTSIVEERYLGSVKKLLEQSPRKIFLPDDCKAAPSIEVPFPISTVQFKEEMKEIKGLDIGPQTIRRFVRSIKEMKPKTIFCNGPMGVFELSPFEEGTRGLIACMMECAKEGARVIFGGGDMVAAFNRFGKPHPNIHLSTGGGAALEFLEGKTLPGIAALCETAVR